MKERSTNGERGRLEEGMRRGGERDGKDREEKLRH